MKFDDINSPPNHPQSTARSKIEVLFEFSVPKPKLSFYRAVRAVDGYFRMEKRGEHAKKFRTIMWCGSEEGLAQHREAVEYYCGDKNAGRKI